MGKWYKGLLGSPCLFFHCTIYMSWTLVDVIDMVRLQRIATVYGLWASLTTNLRQMLQQWCTEFVHSEWESDPLICS